MIFEQAFETFLESEQYDQAEDALFSLARAAFLAGWVAAGGKPPQPIAPLPFPKRT